MAMIGDAISHSILPGIVLAFLFFGERNAFFMILGAVLFGLLLVFMVEYFTTKINLQNDVSIGFSYTFLFALGIILISLFTGKVDIDTDCVLYGEIGYVPLDTVYIMDTDIGPRSFWITIMVLLSLLILLKIGFKALYITSFDPNYASSIGVPVVLWNYFLMTQVSVVAVTSFESVGAILVISFLVVPPATAYLVTDKIKPLFIGSAVIGVLSSVLGYTLSIWLNVSISASMAVVSGLFFTLALIFSSLKKKRDINKYLSYRE
ncbi:manganese ABC transporter, inner membrane permease protein SitD [Ichthyobacterium seriolicida]|uniref:Manganese ABC transporter, inner membrane permease protein SitD n=2 Tax=Ichthyobacterium seriolicida TaxID=242600 RepID=A0A1J1E9N3_9FLAO|nr:manganese ABC transporter, inner membrane permease protein SitD [Ichthyobacterium seriolicida]